MSVLSSSFKPSHVDCQMLPGWQVAWGADTLFEFGMGVSYASLKVIPDLVSSFFHLLPCFAAGLTQFLQFFGCRLLFGTQLMNCLGTRDLDVSPRILCLGFQ